MSGNTDGQVSVGNDKEVSLLPRRVVGGLVVLLEHQPFRLQASVTHLHANGVRWCAMAAQGRAAFAWRG